MAKKISRLERMLDRIAKAIRDVEIEIASSRRFWYETPHVNEFEVEDLYSLCVRRTRLLAFYRKKEKELDAMKAIAAV